MNTQSDELRQERSSKSRFNELAVGAPECWLKDTLAYNSSGELVVLKFHVAWRVGVILKT